MNLVEDCKAVEMFPKENIKEEKNIYKLLASFSCSPKSPRDSLPNYCIADCGEDAFFTIETTTKFCLGIFI